MKFKNFLEIQETQDIINESLNVLDKVKNIKEIVKELDTKTLVQIIKQIKEYYTKVISKFKIKDLEIEAKNLIQEVEKQIKIALNIKHKIKTEYLDDLIKTLNKLIDTIKFHLNNEIQKYKSKSPEKFVNLGTL